MILQGIIVFLKFNVVAFVEKLPVTGCMHKNIRHQILLYKKTGGSSISKTEAAPLPPYPASTDITLEGAIKERKSGDPIVWILWKTEMDTVTNQSGQFLHKIPDSLQNACVHFLHIG